MSGGSDSTQTTTSSLPAWVEPYARSYLDRAVEVADQPYQAYGGQQVAGLNDAQYQAMDAIRNRAMAGSPVLNTAQQSLRGIAGGQVTNPFAAQENPYLQQMIDAASADVTRNYRDAVTPQLDQARAQSGSYGNSGLEFVQQRAQDDLSRQLGNISTGMRMQDYTQRAQLAENQAGRQMQAIGMAPQFAAQDYTDAAALMGVGSTLQGQQQQQLTNQYQQWQQAQQYPLQRLQALGGALGANYGMTNTATGSAGSGSTLGNAAGGALTGWGATGSPWGAALGGVAGLLG